MGALEELGAHLATNVSELTLGDTLYLGALPESTSAGVTVALMLDPGLPPQRIFGGDPWVERPRLRVLLRSTEGAAGARPSLVNVQQRARDVWFTLERVIGTTMTASSGTSSRWPRIEPVGSPFIAGEDDRGRVVWQIEADCWREPSTGS